MSPTVTEALLVPNHEKSVFGLNVNAVFKISGGQELYEPRLLLDSKTYGSTLNGVGKVFLPSDTTEHEVWFVSLPPGVRVLQDVYLHPIFERYEFASITDLARIARLEKSIGQSTTFTCEQIRGGFYILYIKADDGVERGCSLTPANPQEVIAAGSVMTLIMKPGVNRSE